MEIEDTESLVPKSGSKQTVSENTEKNTNVFNALKWPLIMYGLVGGLTIGNFPGEWIWFSWHPLCMLLAYVSLAGNAALIKKIGGYENTKTHGYMMSGAITLASLGFYVIYSNKEMARKPHLMSIHGKLGFTVLVMYFALGAFGAIALHPDFGIMKTNKTLRTVHKLVGRAATAFAWTSCVLGFMNMTPSLWMQAVMATPLLVAGFYVLL
ncbi:eukaryotic cytochrome b561-domain-containing protein [Ochromonadaceae sp. CCMP2298]|nr:eukaryotic cytochrome b561-domain-containing protein [Ochromonadaceae sp. CCMP2298]|mmetsp:Transcript_33020/g.71373  ORF Transcript_33020/g.71373 Transcript_33020/m.71373 type:complete len:210 (-) Transcript_33020:289-918(-)|eukprot:CAMPEP_0173178070 /NCGR_PEP_ID=MMETSP1141-20130122/5328_1 /TAXON_ID=483371 /ORGANISM="non described non described, Strain CCMP2298" /LENGTH=209 /DNA_ID=CAMNT_0014100513 /DNA_START=84 /DNA_END=713 /DNA_ORIENTATION=+